jgi:hypothetical protein
LMSFGYGRCILKLPAYASPEIPFHFQAENDHPKSLWVTNDILHVTAFWWYVRSRLPGYTYVPLKLFTDS